MSAWSGGGAARHTLTAALSATSPSPLVWIIGVVLLVALVAVVVTLLLARRAGRRAREAQHLLTMSGDEPGDLAAVLGTCADEEREVERLEHATRQVAMQLEQARRRTRDEMDQASRARDRAMKALEARTSLRAARLAGEHTFTREPLTWAQLSFTTDEGRVVFERFRRGEMPPVELRRQLSQLGEHRVIAQIIAEGDRRRRSDPTIPWPEEQQAVRDAIGARDELRAHERAASEAHAEAQRLAARADEIARELATARQRLDDCRRSAERPTFDDV